MPIYASYLPFALCLPFSSYSSLTIAVCNVRGIFFERTKTSRPKACEMGLGDSRDYSTTSSNCSITSSFFERTKKHLDQKRVKWVWVTVVTTRQLPQTARSPRQSTPQSPPCPPPPPPFPCAPARRRHAHAQVEPPRCPPRRAGATRSTRPRTAYAARRVPRSRTSPPPRPPRQTHARTPASSAVYSASAPSSAATAGGAATRTA